MFGEPFSKEQAEWIRENASCGFFRDKKHFLSVFNAIFSDNRTLDGMTNYLRRNNITVITKVNTRKMPDEQTQWLKKHCCDYEVFADLVRAFNDQFDTNIGYPNLARRCVTLGLREYDSERQKRNTGQFVKGKKYGAEECEIGTIRYNKQRNMCFIKVQMCKGKFRDTSGHDLKEPFWRPLQDKIWEDHFGNIPVGYMACPLNCNPYEDDIKNIGLIDKRGKAIMSRKGWWSENSTFTAVAVMWCNLWFVAKDHNV